MTLTLDRSGPVATVTLSRPNVHNAFDAALVASLRDTFRALAADEGARVVVLAGAGESFCAGGDLSWMRDSLAWSREQNLADAEAMADMFEAAWALPKPLVARVHGAAIGGGAGLVACCDLAVAAQTARFGFSEVRLGLLPAVIAQYVVPKIGLSQARALLVSGERFTAERAFEIGLVHAVTPPDELDATVRALVMRLLNAAPGAVAETKRVIDAVWHLERAEARRFVVEAIASARAGAEGQEGVRAFLEKRRPGWSRDA